MAQKDKQTRKFRILVSAKREFAQNGYYGARMSSIAKSAEVQQALLHYYFQTKENLYLETIKKFIYIENAALVAERLLDFNFEIKEHLLAELYIDTFLIVKINDIDINLIIYKGLLENRQEIKDMVNNYFTPILLERLSIVQKGIDKGIFESSNPLMAIFAVHDFIIRREESKNTIKDTNLYKHIYGESIDDEFEVTFSFASEMLFKLFSHKDKLLKIPKLDNEVYRKLDDLINDIYLKNRDIGDENEE